MANSYEHTQKGNSLFYWGIPLVVIAVYLGAIAVSNFIAPGTPQVQGGWILGLLCIILVSTWAGVSMSSLTVSIHREFVRIRFGSGILHKKFQLNQIESATPVRNRWYMDWGIHWIGSGWLYNVAGFDAVELTFKNGKKVRIGTDEPEQLCRAIEQALHN